MRTNLKVFRVRKQMTQDEFSNAIGVKRPTYSAVENGKRSGRSAFWSGLQKAFDIPDSEMYELMKNE